MIGEMFIELPADLQKEFVGLWNQENSAETIESQVVKTADKLQLLSKSFEEIQAGNTYFEEIYKRELKKLKELDFSWWKKIKNEVLSGAEKQV